jgi:hypothetical protein
MNIFKYKLAKDPLKATHAKLKGFKQKIVQAEAHNHDYLGVVVSIESPLQRKDTDDNYFILEELPFYGITLLEKRK